MDHHNDDDDDDDGENDFAAETAAMTQVWHGGDIHEAEVEFVASQASVGNNDDAQQFGKLVCHFVLF